MGQGRHTLRSVSDPVYPPKDSKESTYNTLDGFCKCMSTVSVPNLKNMVTATLTVRITHRPTERN